MELAIEQKKWNLQYLGNGFEMALLMLKNLLLTILTLGLYWPWARTDMRRYVWGNTKFMGDRAAYHGTGYELFIGWLKLMGILFLALFAIGIVQAIVPILSAPLGLLIYAVYIIVFGLAVYGGLRYRMSRTTWRQVRFGVDKDKESTKEFIKTYLAGLFLSIITLGLYYPYFKHHTRKFLVDRSRLGTAHFSYDGTGNDLFWIYCKGLILTILTFGIYYVWFFKDLLVYRAQHTLFQGSRFSFDVRGRDLFLFAVVAYFGTILTFGLAFPWIYNWGMGLILENIAYHGTFDPAGVQAVASDGSAMADEIVEAYDLDIGF